MAEGRRIQGTLEEFDMRFICETCGTEYGDTMAPPAVCAICADERQYVRWSGQRWTTHADLVRTHSVRIQDESGITALRLSPDFAINQRALLVPTESGNILWECLSAVTAEALAAIQAMGGVQRIVISHPHFYAAMGEWSDALGGVPILLHEADRHWVQRPHPAIEHWSGDELQLFPGITLIRCGGHFAGSTVLHSAAWPRSRGALLSGDALQVIMDRRHVSFMYSYPNLIPMRTSDVVAMRERLAKYEFEDVYGYTWGRNIIGDARAAVDTSFERYLRAVTG
jgi:hypothetical protein